MLYPQEFSREVSTEEGKAFADRMGSLFVGKHGSVNTLTDINLCHRMFRQDETGCTVCVRRPSDEGTPNALMAATNLGV